MSTSTTTHRHRLVHELAPFAVIGGIGYLVDVSAFNLLRFAGDPGLLEGKPLTAKALSVTLATVVTYLGNRHWTWRDRHWSGFRREYVVFFGLNAVGLAIALGCLATSHYVLGLTSALADNVSANGVGLALGTAFRFWAYPRYVFRGAP
ncbi:MAG: GtrA family protein [Nocardioidaceae bacterium]|nr:GtrA family protein [Nocardioidaceae bacterium]MDQ3164951.1 GtrA family protein [Actinomycetota bacterium]